MTSILKKNVLKTKNVSKSTAKICSDSSFEKVKTRKMENQEKMSHVRAEA